MMRTIVLCSVSALTLCVPETLSIARPAVPVTHAHGEVHRVIAAVPGSVTLYDQNNDDAGVAIISTNFDVDFDSYDSYGADDFLVPAGHKWKIREVEVSGIYGQGTTHPAVSENVLFYRDSKDLPGTLVAKCEDIQGLDNNGSFAIKIPKSCKVNLRGGRTYWLSVVANEGAPQVNWFWETRNTQNGNPAAWENPGGGFGIGCRSWAVMAECFHNDGEGPDFMFTIKGNDITLR